MTNEEIFAFVKDQMDKGINRIDSIRNLAWCMDEDDPEDDAEAWLESILNQKTGLGVPYKNSNRFWGFLTKTPYL